MTLERAQYLDDCAKTAAQAAKDASHYPWLAERAHEWECIAAMFAGQASVARGDPPLLKLGPGGVFTKEYRAEDIKKGHGRESN